MATVFKVEQMLAGSNSQEWQLVSESPSLAAAHTQFRATSVACKTPGDQVRVIEPKGVSHKLWYSHTEQPPRPDA